MLQKQTALLTHMDKCKNMPRAMLTLFSIMILSGCADPAAEKQEDDQVEQLQVQEENSSARIIKAALHGEGARSWKLVQKTSWTNGQKELNQYQASLEFVYHENGVFECFSHLSGKAVQKFKGQWSYTNDNLLREINGKQEVLFIDHLDEESLVFSYPIGNDTITDQFERF